MSRAVSRKGQREARRPIAQSRPFRLYRYMFCPKVPKGSRYVPPFLGKLLSNNRSLPASHPIKIGSFLLLHLAVSTDAGPIFRAYYPGDSATSARWRTFNFEWCSKSPMNFALMLGAEVAQASELSTKKERTFAKRSLFVSQFAGLVEVKVKVTARN